MKKKSPVKALGVASRKTQEMQTVALIVIGAAVVVLACIVAVLLAQADRHRDSIDAIEQTLSVDE